MVGVGDPISYARANRCRKGRKVPNHEDSRQRAVVSFEPESHDWAGSEFPDKLTLFTAP